MTLAWTSLVRRARIPRCVKICISIASFSNSSSFFAPTPDPGLAFEWSFKIEASEGDPCSDGGSAVIKPNGACDGTLCGKFQNEGPLDNSVCGQDDFSDKEITLECESKGVMTVALAGDWPVDIYPNFKGGNAGETVFVVGPGGSVTGSTGVNSNNGNPAGAYSRCP